MFDRSQLPDPANYFNSEGLRLKGARHANWKTTECRFHGGSDSMRVNVATGAFRCMNCQASGGDVLAYHMQVHGLEFVAAAKALGAWIDDGTPYIQQKPAALSARDALEVLGFESTLVAVAAGNLANGLALTEADRARLFTCAGRIHRIVEDYVR